MGKATSGLASASIRLSIPAATSTMARTVSLSLAAFSAWGDFMPRSPPDRTIAVSSEDAAAPGTTRKLAVERLARLATGGRRGRPRGHGGAAPPAVRGRRRPPPARGGDPHHPSPCRPPPGPRAGGGADGRPHPRAPARGGARP